MASPSDAHSVLVQRIRSARAALRTSTDLRTRDALLAELAAAVQELVQTALEDSEAAAVRRRQTGADAD